MKKYKLAAALMACMIASAPFAAPKVKAEGNNNSQTIDKAQIHSCLVLKSGVPVPSVTFNYTIQPGQAVNGTDNTHDILAGPDGAVFTSNRSTTASVSFTPDDTAADGSSAPDEAFVEKVLTVDLSKVTFPTAGIYRYIITEEPSNAAGITSDSVSKRYLNVFVNKSVQNEEDKFVPGAFIVRLNDGLPDAEGKADAAVKSTGFTNRYSTNNLGFAKSVTGNQASFNQYFKFTVRLIGSQSAWENNTRVKVSGEFDSQPSENMATVYDADVMTAANDGVEYVTLSQLIDGRDFYIKNGQSVLLTGIPAGMGYEVTEAQEDYSPSVKVTGDTECTNADSKVTDRSLTDDTTLSFLNTRNGIIPSTGVSAAFALPAAVMLAGIAGMVLLLARRVKRMKEKTSEGNGIE